MRLSVLIYVAQRPAESDRVSAVVEYFPVSSNKKNKAFFRFCPSYRGLGDLPPTVGLERRSLGVLPKSKSIQRWTATRNLVLVSCRLAARYARGKGRGESRQEIWGLSTFNMQGTVMEIKSSLTFLVCRRFISDRSARVPAEKKAAGKRRSGTDADPPSSSSLY